jgi:hypothetical protein
MQQNPNLFAGLGPFAGLAQAGSQLATRGIQGLFGIKDPELERRRILSQVNYDDPESIRAAAQALMAQGDVEVGMQLASQARQIQQQEKQFGLSERGVKLQEKAGQRAEEAALQTRIKEAPYAAIGEVAALPDGKEKEALLTQISNNISKSNLDTAVKEQQLRNLANTVATSNGYSSTIYKDANNNPLFTKGSEGGYWYYDEESGKMKRASSKGIQTIKPPTPNPYEFLAGARAGATGNQPLAATGQPRGQAGGSLAEMQARAAQALRDKMNK